MLVSGITRRAYFKGEGFDLFLDVVHDDIKPQIVLVFSDFPCRRTVRSSGFGASSFIPFSDQDHLRYVSKSNWWTAPEHRHRGFTFTTTVKMDIYSF